MQWFGPAGFFLGSALSYWWYRSPESAMRWMPSLSWPQSGDLTPQGRRRLSSRHGEVAVVFLLVGIVWSGGIVLSACEEDRSPEFEQCVEEERPKEYSSGRSAEEICDSRYPALVTGRLPTG